MKYKDQNRESAVASSSSFDTRIKKASYYVWFLGAEECRGLRGPEIVKPIMHYLVQRERESEPEKVTLQVSGKGIKLLQQGVTSRSTAVGTTKHFIPAGALTYVQVETPPDDDIVSTVLLIYNPVTRCPVHVHCYRCDSTETAELLRNHLQQLLMRPEQQAKLSALEGRLASRGLLPNSEGGSSGSSISSGAGSSKPVAGEKMSSLYDSLAAELREKLKGKGAPLLLPPRDYEKTIRLKNRVTRVESGVRKSLDNESVRSSGIGSDGASSPTNYRKFGSLDHQSSSDEEWTGHESAEVRGETGFSLASWRERSFHEVSCARSPSPRHGNHHKDKYGSHLSSKNALVEDLPPLKISRSLRYAERTYSPESPQERFIDARDKFLSLERQRSAVEVPIRRNIIQMDKFARSTSWEVNPHSHYGKLPGHKKRGIREHIDSREEITWPKSDKDTGYGSRDALKEKRKSREWEPKDVDCINHDSSRRTPDTLESHMHENYITPTRSRNRTPVKDHRMPRIRSPNRQEYMRAKSMHDLSYHKKCGDENRKGFDPRRHSFYDLSDSSLPLKANKKLIHGSHGHLGRAHSISSSSSLTSNPATKYHELPDNQRFPGLDRATARQDIIDPVQLKRTYDYPVNGGHAPMHITRAQHDDYRKFRYDHNDANYLHSAVLGSPY